MKKIFHFVFITFLHLSSIAQITVQAHAGLDKFVCAGDSVQIGGNPIASNATFPIAIVWTPNSNISNNTIANPYVWPTSTTTYYLNITDANGRSATDSVIVNFHIPSAVTLINIPHTCLSNDPFKLSSGLPTGGWYRGKSISDSITFHPNLAGIGNHEITYYYRDSICSTLDSAKSPITVVLNPTITALLSSDSLCKGDSLTIKGMGGAFYKWKSTAPLSSNTGDSILTWPDSTSFYWIIGTDTAGCMDSMIFTVFVLDCVTGIKQIQSNVNIKVYPNPFSNVIYIENTSVEIEKIRILSIEGKILTERKMDQITIQKIDLSDTGNGIIVIEFLDNVGQVLSIKRLIKKSP